VSILGVSLWLRSTKVVFLPSSIEHDALSSHVRVNGETDMDHKGTRRAFDI
jgi:hypothetical protein